MFDLLERVGSSEYECQVPCLRAWWGSVSPARLWMSRHSLGIRIPRWQSDMVVLFRFRSVGGVVSYALPVCCSMVDVMGNGTLCEDGGKARGMKKTGNVCKLKQTWFLRKVPFIYWYLVIHPLVGASTLSLCSI